MAGINAALRTKGKAPLILGRGDAYIGVLIDDLVTLGTREPYRMFTSRAEFRLLLREDNADLRLREKGHEIGLVREEDYDRFCVKRQMIADELDRIRSTRIVPSGKDSSFLLEFGLVDLHNGISYEQLLRRTEFSYQELMRIDATAAGLPYEVREQVEIQVKYEGYIKRQMEQIERSARLENSRIPEDFDYAALAGLSSEVREKLLRFRPDTLGQASRIQGVTPAAVSILAVALKTGRPR
jgi:tRNA uridine 5-carboxymethylaminomethyl modification enzyme